MSGDPLRTARAAVIALWCGWLAGCGSTIELAPRPYLCAPDAGDSAAQCAEGWRCGLEATCHPRSVATDYLCRTDADCEGGWRCGRSGRCHARDVAEAYPCADSTDCELGWHCGVAGTCYPRDAGGSPLPCRDDADCAFDWRCGREALCHAVGAPSDYPCVDDQDCEASWRCGFSGRCADAPAEGLPPGAAGIDVRRLNPVEWAGPPDLVSFSPTEGVIVGNGAEVLVPGWKGAPLRFTSPSRVDALLAAADGPWALADGGLYHLTADGGLFPPASLVVPPGVDRLRFAMPGEGAMLGLGGDQLWWIEPGALPDVRELPLPAEDGGRQQIHDVIAFAPYQSNSGCLLAAGEEGLQLALQDGGAFLASDGGLVADPEWIPLDLPPFTHGAQTDGLVVTALRPLFGLPQSVALGVIARPRLTPDAGEWVSVLLPCPILNGGGGPACPTSLRCAENFPGRVVVGPCQACDPDEQVLDLIGISSGGTYGYAYVSCGRQEAGGLRVRTREIDHLCNEYPTRNILQSDFVKVVPSGPTRGLALTGAHGEVWSSRSWSLYDDADPLVLDTRPVAAVGGREAMRVVISGRPSSTAPVYRPGALGLEPSSLEPRERYPWFEVAGADDWIGTCDPGLYAYTCGDQVLDTSRIGPDAGFLTLGGTNTTAADAFELHAAAATLPDGGRALVMTTLDSVWAGLATGTAPLELAAVPQPKTPIHSLTVLAPGDAGAPLVAGYLLTPNGLFGFRSDDLLRYSATELSAPPGQLDEVWSEGVWGRLGDADGVVYSLPSLLTLSDPLPEPVVDYAQACGTAFALTAGGAYVLDPAADAGAVGHWRLLPLDSVLPPAAETGFAGGFLHSTASGVTLFTAYGTAIELSVDGGCR